MSVFMLSEDQTRWETINVPSNSPDQLAVAPPHAPGILVMTGSKWTEALGRLGAPNEVLHMHMWLRGSFGDYANFCLC